MLEAHTARLGETRHRPIDAPPAGDWLDYVAGCIRALIEETGVAMGVLGHPATGVAWLANKFAQHGARLEAGEIILAGSFTRPLWVSAGDEVRCEYGPMGEITCRFV